MPKLNRYHPYARPSPPHHPSSTQPLLASPRYPSPPTLQYPKPLSSITEHISNPQPSLTNYSRTPSLSSCSTSSPAQPIETYLPIYPGYIRAVTSDGAPLIARSILRSEDGTFFVKMEIVSLPSPAVPPHIPCEDSRKSAYTTFINGSSYSASVKEHRNSNPKQTSSSEIQGVPVYPTPQASSVSGSEASSGENAVLEVVHVEDEGAEGDVDDEYQIRERRKGKIMDSLRDESRRMRVVR